MTSRCSLKDLAKYYSLIVVRQRYDQLRYATSSITSFLPLNSTVPAGPCYSNVVEVLFRGRFGGLHPQAKALSL